MKFSPTPIEPVPRPVLRDAMVGGDPVIERDVAVLVGGVAFRFWRLDDDTWTGGTVETAVAGYPLDERWLTAARGARPHTARA